MEDASRGFAILLIDDNPAIARAIEIAFRMAGHRLDGAAGPEEAFSRIARQRYDAILLDMNFSAGAASGDEGLACLRRIMADNPSACVVVITAHSGIRIAVAAMQAGARDFVMKPWRNADLIAKVETAVARGRPITPAPAATVLGEEAPPVLLGESAAMYRLRELVRRVAPTPAGLTVTGRPGSGRTLTARAIHAASRVADRPVIRIDLRDESAWSRFADIPATVILRYPDRLDLIAQARLLECLPAAARYVAIADTIAPLVPALRQRIATVEVAVPPLGEREDDVVLLARHFARTAAARFERPGSHLTEAAEAMIRATAWPDEVRGLESTVERAVLLADGGIIDAARLAPFPVSGDPVDDMEAIFDLTGAEKALIEAALRGHHNNMTHAAAALGLSRGALYRRMARHGL